MNFVQVLKQCETANGEGTKKIIKESLKALDSVSQKLMRYAQDKFLVFGVRKFDQPTSFASEDPSDLSFLFETLDKLAAREITGDAARNAVTVMLSQFTQETASYIERIIDKDLKAGFSVDTYNTIAEKEGWEKVRVFTVMLADKCEEIEDFETYVTFPCQGDIKYDGERNVAYQLVQETNIARAGSSYFSRSGKEAVHMNGLFDEELQRIRDYVGFDFILDGERMAGDFTETTNAKKSGKDGDAAKANMRFRAFFLMPLTDWVAQKTNITMKANRIALAKILEECKCEKIILSKGREVKDYDDMIAYCDEVTTPGYDGLTNGQEGLILKDWDAVYTWDRTYAWTKVKKFYDVDVRIVGFYPGRPKSRLANTVGGVNCVGFLESGERVEFNMGSGFSDSDREDMKNNPDKWLALTHVVKYQEVSRSKSKKVASLRFPVYKHSRDDKIVEID